MTTARKTRGNPRKYRGKAEIPREVNFLTIAREFRGNGNRNRNPVSKLKIESKQSKERDTWNGEWGLRHVRFQVTAVLTK